MKLGMPNKFAYTAETASLNHSTQAYETLWDVGCHELLLRIAVFAPPVHYQPIR